MNKLVIFTLTLFSAPLFAAEHRTLSLVDAIAAADANLPALRQSRADTAATKYTADIALSPLLPQVGGTANYQRRTANFAPQPGQVTQGGTEQAVVNSTSTYNYFAFGISLSQTIFDAPTFSRWRAALATLGAQKALFEAARLDAAYNVRVGFFNAQAMQALVDVAKQTLANQERHLEQTRGFVTVGTHPEIDLAQSKTNVANARVALINAENNAETAKAQLNQYMGVESDTDYSLGEGHADPIDLEDQGIADQVAAAAKTRPELIAFEERLHAQALALGANKWGFAPTLGASTGLTDNGVSLDNTAWNWNFQATLTWQLFSGLGTYASVKQAQAQLESLQAQRDAERIQVRLELERARLAVRAAKATVGASADALENAQLLEKLADGRYKAGVGNSVELSDAELQLANAAVQRVQADFNVGTARSQLLRALGRR